MSPERADILLGVILDPTYRKIITCVKDKFKNIQQICDETGMVVSTVYRRARILEEKQVLIIRGQLREDGGKEKLYKSKIRKVVATFDDGKMDIEIFTNLRN